jgi:hypothetical protein
LRAWRLTFAGTQIDNQDTLRRCAKLVEPSASKIAVWRMAIAINSSARKPLALALGELKRGKYRRTFKEEFFLF